MPLFYVLKSQGYGRTFHGELVGCRVGHDILYSGSR